MIDFFVGGDELVTRKFVAGCVAEVKEQQYTKVFLSVNRLVSKL